MIKLHKTYEKIEKRCAAITCCVNLHRKLHKRVTTENRKMKQFSDEEIAINRSG